MRSNIEPFAERLLVHHPRLLIEGWVERSNAPLTVYRDDEGCLFAHPTRELLDGPIPGGDFDRTLTPRVIDRVEKTLGISRIEIKRRADANGISLYNACEALLEPA